MKLVKTKYEKILNTKNTWKKVDTYIDEVSEQFFKNAVNAKDFFEDIGGLERHKQKTGYYEITSISPNKQVKCVYQFYY